ncbi:SpoIIE-like protein phosphatase domain protein [Leptospira fainei serovar Hurstbridge str. BUT 6]|uniref:SpoIIE-like protein phosphatase domain protein n=1 Tax=Leptospira fainei serovar Hurstbridge str. BUT 6 TaxID=1193011 RepID=S3VY81_9LEPT|nr:SpoIIE family protein phosphatase [Leptospira fainei]EPG73077.1 SpoIIE-like protein phosphatase domain protein [Leptospira fainei serovar Hurstbridge str. BUT 6]
MLYFDSWAISTLICCIFTFTIFAFLATLKNKAKYTAAFSVLFLWVFLINFGFLISALFPYPEAAYHRLLTGPGAAFGTLFLCVFSYLYPRNDRPKEAKIVLSVMIILALSVVAYSYYQILTSRPIFDFQGQIYTYPASVGSLLALIMIAFLLIMIVIQVRKIITSKAEEKKALTQMSVAMVLTYLVPIISNFLLRGGYIKFHIFQQLYVGFMILGYFSLTIVFINNTVDKTSFMTKIVGITVVTSLVFAQGFSTVLNLRNESLFDQISLKEALSFVSTGRAEGTAIAYVISISEGSKKPKVLLAKDGYEPNPNAAATEIAKIKATDGFLKRIPTVNVPKTSEGQERYVSKPDDLFYSYYIQDSQQGRIFQVVFPYMHYRSFLDETNRWTAILTLVLVIVILTLFPIFFNRSLVRPLNTLIKGVGEVNLGNLYVKIPVLVQDEIGYLSDAFNNMVQSILEGRTKLEEYADTLEEKVELRTKEVTEKMEEIQSLKVQQDGDYYLTSLLSRPLMTNWNKSQIVSTNFYIEQKKKFTFRNKESELGGDICISGNLLFGNDKDRWIVFINGDAMGKSMQGAGGAIVLGTAMNNIMARSASKGRILNTSPEEWITDTYRELDDIFRTFDGVMMASVILGVINERTGKMLYFNAEHPWTVLYRDGKASFLEKELTLRKLGSPSEMSFRILECTLSAGDVLYVGSDGRDDINVSHDGNSWTMNEDETVFLRLVETAKGDLDAVVNQIHKLGALSDDLSLIRIGYQESTASVESESRQLYPELAIRKFSEAKALVLQHEISTAIILLEEAIKLMPSFKEAVRLLGQIYYDKKEYEAAAKWFKIYLESESDSPNIWFLLSICYKHLKEYLLAAGAAEKVRLSQPHRLANLVNLSDSYRLLGKWEEARTILETALLIDKESPGVQKLNELLKSRGY